MQNELNQFFSEKKHLYNPYSKLQEIKLVNIGLASSEQIKKWAEKKLPNGKVIGQVTNANTLHHKTFKPLKGGLFCERIFGPVKDFQCSCGKTKKFTSSILAQFKEEKIYKNDFQEIYNNENKERERIFCPVCDVEYTWSVIRRYQLGYIQLVAPVTHLWYLKGSPSYLSLLLDMKKKKLESVVYCSENMTLETTNSIVFSKQFSFFFEKKKGSSFNFSNIKGLSKTPVIKGQNSRDYKSQKPTSSLYNSWEKILKSLEAKKSSNSFNHMNSGNSLIKKNKKELIFSKFTSYLFFLKNKAKKASIQKSLNCKTLAMEKHLKPKRLSGWRNLKIQTLNSLFENFYYFKKRHLKTNISVPIKIFLKLKNLKKIGYLNPKGILDEKFIDFLTNSKNYKVIYKIAHKKVHQIILKIQIEFLKKNIKEILDNNFSNINSTKPLLNEKNAKLALASFFIRKKEKNTFNFEKIKKEAYLNPRVLEKRFNNTLIFNNFDKTNDHEHKVDGTHIYHQDKRAFLFNEYYKKENKDRVFFSLNVSRTNQSPRFYEKLKIIKSILIFRIKKEIFNSEINKTPFSHFSWFFEKKNESQIKNAQAPVNFFNIEKDKGPKESFFSFLSLDEKETANRNKRQALFFLLSGNKRTNLKFFNLSIYANNLKNLTISNYTTLDLKEKNKILFLFTFFIFNFFLPISFVFPKPSGGLYKPLGKEKILNQIKTKNNRKKFVEKSLKIIRINTLNKIIENVGLEEIKNYYEELKKKSFFSKKQNFVKNIESLENEKTKKTILNFPPLWGKVLETSQNFRVMEKKGLFKPSPLMGERFGERKEKSKKSGSSFTKQNYSLYCISHRFCWENEKDWSNFVYFFSAPTKMDDLPISTYIERIPSTFQRPFSGAKVLQKLLTEFHFQEFKKMDRQNRILLYELNKQIQKDFSESQLNLKNSHLEKNIKTSQNFRVMEKKSLSNSGFEETHGHPGEEKSINLAFTLWEKRQKRKFAQKRDQLIRRTKFIRKLFRKNSQPESMILSFLPVLPPDLRPILKIQDQIAASDLNRLYQRVLYRNERLKKFLKDSAMSYSYEMKYAQRLLQEAVDNLLQNGKAGGTPERDSRGRLLKSLSEILKGKQGRFRQHLLGKRVDYSGRSVIVVGPQLKIHECGLPKEMALELFLPFLLKRLIHLKIARTVIGAKTILKNNPTFTWEILYEVMQNYPVLLNRAPTLHRLGIQAFQPKLVEGRAILLHPLVCPAFNADFDGDQMAVHIPLTVEARSEAWKLMCSGNHFFSPATGDPLLLPSQDMVLGCYYLTTEKQIRHKILLPSKRKKIIENSFGLDKKNIHDIIWVKWDGSLESLDEPEDPLEIRINSFGYWNEIFSKSQYHFDLNGLLMSQFIRTTNGRLFFNEMLSFFYK